MNSCVNIHALSTRTAFVQEIFVCQLTLYLATVTNFIKEQSKADMSPWFCCCPLADVVERFQRTLLVQFIYARAGKSSILKMLLTTLKAKTTRRRLPNSFCQYSWSSFAPQDIIEVGFRGLYMVFLVSCCSEWTFLLS